MTLNQQFTPLDNAAKIYPCISSIKGTPQYRVGAYLTEKVCPEKLTEAVGNLKERFPLIYSQLHRGKYWYFLKPATDTDVVYPDIHGQQRPFPLYQTNRPLFRVLYKDKYVALEVFHSLTDGHGGIELFKSILWEYFSLCGKKLKDRGDIRIKGEAVPPEELQDDYQALYNRKDRLSRAEEDAVVYPAQWERGLFKICRVFLEVDKLKVLTKSLGCTVNDYLMSALLCGIANACMTKDITGKVTVGCNIDARPVFNSKTLRNFSLFTNVSIYSKGDELYVDDVLADVQAQLREGCSKKTLQTLASQNVHEEKQLIARITPMDLKLPVMRMIFGIYSGQKTSTQLSNMGLIKLPPEMAKYIDYMEFLLGRGGGVPLCSAISCNNKLCMSMSGGTKDVRVKDCFVQVLEHDGLTPTQTEN